MECPLCSQLTQYFWEDKHRQYRHCECCDLVHVPRQWQLSPVAEKAVYDCHDNRVDDPSYRAFLARLFDPLQSRLAPHALGLDFGCGPGPALAAMAQESGFAMRLYDRYYYPDASVLSGEYDFITATEVVEHLAAPGNELNRLWSILRPSGWLGIMTKRWTSLDAFKQWHYKNDPTHICFFSERTFAFLAASWQTRAIVVSADAVLFNKQDHSVESKR